MLPHISLACFLGLSVLGISFEARADIKIEAPACACDEKISDPFETRLQYNFGPFQGQCVNSCKYRNVVILPPDKSEKILRVANILHDNQYWIAEIPENEVEEVSIIFEKFLSSISHVALKFHLKHPMNLKAQVGKAQTQIQDFLFSAEGTPPRGSTYNLWDGAQGNYFLSMRFFSLEQAVQTMVKMRNHQVSQFRLNLSPEKRWGVLREGLRRSMKNSFNSIYQLISNNCATTALDLLDSQTGFQEVSSWMNWEKGIPVDFSYGTLHALELRGLVNLGVDRLPDLSLNSGGNLNAKQ